MSKRAIAGLVWGVAALALAGCGESLRDSGGDTGPIGATPPDDDSILRGDVGDFVWVDANDNGLQDDGPMSGVNGVDVTIDVIRSLDGSFWTMTFTTTNSPVTGLPGWYNFNSVPAGACSAYVEPATIPAGYQLGSHACGGPLLFTIGEGPTGNNNPNVDFCLVPIPPPPGAIGDFVWCDTNDDGVQDPGEPGIPGIVVNLSCADGSTASTVTDANGLYLFSDVHTGVACTVTIDPASFPPDKTPGTHCPTTRTVTLAPGETNLLQDFCLILIPPPPGGEGCTPGYWKNHPESWAPTGYTTGQALSTVFDMSNFPSLGSKTLLEALSFKGGSTLTEKAQILLRAAVAALLSSSHPGVDYPRSTADVILDVNNALESNNATTIQNLAFDLDLDNNLGCPLN
jgi:hypothetical protein